jgi:glycosyltransferase involved in cell wall biosynthesis
MPVHNALPYLDDAVESILDQTFSDFEFVVLDDASTDGSRERLHHWATKDARIRVIEVSKNLGPARSSDRVARAASAPIVARMDADDLSHPERLERQLEVLKQDPRVGLVASFCDVVDACGRTVRTAEAWRATRHSPFVPFAHGTIMYRQSVFEQVGGYRAECEYWEDQDLIARMGIVSAILIVPKTLYRVRQSTISTRAASRLEIVERAIDLMYRCTARMSNGQDYGELLHERRDPQAKLDPRVFIAIGSVHLWAGMRPQLFRRMLRRSTLSFSVKTFSALVWTVWASASPATLRLFLRILLRLRNSAFAPQIDKPVPWTPWRDAPPEIASSSAPSSSRSAPSLERQNRPQGGA